LQNYFLAYRTQLHHCWKHHLRTQEAPFFLMLY
jgi:hypothetical protein